jgi:choline dehydrogenase-like flavoprotein
VLGGSSSINGMIYMRAKARETPLDCRLLKRPLREVSLVRRIQTDGSLICGGAEISGAAQSPQLVATAYRVAGSLHRATAHTL